MGSLSSQTPTLRSATIRDFLAIPSHLRFHELLDGELVRKAMPGARHGAAQRGLGAALSPFGPEALAGQPGGWWILSEVEVELTVRQVVRPDLVGWRLENMLELPDDFPVKRRPDWICEVVSPGDPRRDTVVKLRDYARAGIPHYWLADLEKQTLTAQELRGEHYAITDEADSHQRLCAAPFDAVEIPVGLLFGERRK